MEDEEKSQIASASSMYSSVDPIEIEELLMLLRQTVPQNTPVSSILLTQSHFDNSSQHNESLAESSEQLSSSEEFVFVAHDLPQQRPDEKKSYDNIVNTKYDFFQIKQLRIDATHNSYIPNEYFQEFSLFYVIREIFKKIRLQPQEIAIPQFLMPEFKQFYEELRQEFITTHYIPVVGGVIDSTISGTAFELFERDQLAKYEASISAAPSQASSSFFDDSDSHHQTFNSSGFTTEEEKGSNTPLTTPRLELSTPINTPRTITDERPKPSRTESSSSSISSISIEFDDTHESLDDESLNILSDQAVFYFQNNNFDAAIENFNKYFEHAYYATHQLTEKQTNVAKDYISFLADKKNKKAHEWYALAAAQSYFVYQNNPSSLPEEFTNLMDTAINNAREEGNQEILNKCYKIAAHHHEYIRRIANESVSSISAVSEPLISSSSFEDLSARLDTSLASFMEANSAIEKPASASTSSIFSKPGREEKMKAKETKSEEKRPYRGINF